MRFCHLLSLWKEASGLVCLMAAFFGCYYVATSVQNKPIHFKDVRDFREFAATHDLHFHSGTSSGNLVSPCNNFFVANHPLGIDDLDGVWTRRDCGLTPAWRGILWVCQIEIPQGITTYPDQIGGKWRAWGNVVVAGDEELMNRIEDLIRDK